MANQTGLCPLTQRELIDTFFMEHRAQIIDVAAYLDRLDRSVDANAERDFRLTAMREAVRVLGSAEPGRVEQIQMILSDLVIEPMDTRDRQNAYGADSRQQTGARR
jgi:hypothetical protein